MCPLPGRGTQCQAAASCSSKGLLPACLCPASGCSGLCVGSAGAPAWARPGRSHLTLADSSASDETFQSTLAELSAFSAEQDSPRAKEIALRDTNPSGRNPSALESQLNTYICTGCLGCTTPPLLLPANAIALSASTTSTMAGQKPASVPYCKGSVVWRG